MFGLNETSHKRIKDLLTHHCQQQVNQKSQQKGLLLQASTLQTSQLCLLTPSISSNGPIRRVQSSTESATNWTPPGNPYQH